jgi:hypothetical protein
MTEPDIIKYIKEGDLSGVAGCIEADPQVVNATDTVSYLYLGELITESILIHTVVLITHRMAGHHYTLRSFITILISLGC